MRLDGNLSMTNLTDTYYYFQAGLGSIRNLLDASEAAVSTYDYYAFGDELCTQTDGVASPYRFTAREREPGGLSHAHFYRNRYYMPGVGLFMSRDAFWADEHRGWGYVANAPTMLRDSSGYRSDFCEISELVERWASPVQRGGSTTDLDNVRPGILIDTSFMPILEKILEAGQFGACMGMCLSHFDIVFGNPFKPDALSPEERAQKLIALGFQQAAEQSAEALRALAKKTECNLVKTAIEGHLPSAIGRAAARKHKAALRTDLIKIGDKAIGTYKRVHKSNAAAKVFRRLGKAAKVAAIALCARECMPCRRDQQENGNSTD